MARKKKRSLLDAKFFAKRDLRADYSIGGRKKVVRHPKRLDLIIAPVAKFTAFIYRAKWEGREDSVYLKCTNLTVSLLSGIFHPRTVFPLVTVAQVPTSTVSLKVTPSVNVVDSSLNSIACAWKRRGKKKKKKKIRLISVISIYRPKRSFFISKTKFFFFIFHSNELLSGTSFLFVAWKKAKGD